MTLLRRRFLGLAALALVGILAIVAVVGLTGEDEVRIDEQQLRVEVSAEPDGMEVSLEASVFSPGPEVDGADEAGRRAAVVLAHGFGGSKEQLAAQARELAAAGYVVLTYTARGFGGSGGLIHLNNPEFEIADASRMLDELAGRDDVRLDDVGDPRVGVAGGSYGGALALMTAGLDDRVDAVAAAITWHDLGQSLFPQYGADQGSGVFKKRWASLFFSAGLSGSSGDGPLVGDVDRASRDTPACGRFDATICALYNEAATTARPSREMLELLRASSPADLLGDVEAPTMLVQGQQDSLFPLGEADANARGLAAAGTEVAVRWIDGGHDAGGASIDGDLTDPALDWFDHHLRSGPDPGTAFDFTLPASLFEQDEPREQLTAQTYGDLESRGVPLIGEPQPVLSPPGGEPSALTSLPGTGPLLGVAGSLTGAGYQLAALPGASATFETAPFESSLTIAGAPTTELTVTSTTTDATLFVSAWIVSADGDPSLPRSQVSPVRLDGLTPDEPTTVEVTLPSSAYRIERDQRLRVVVSSTDAAYAVPSDVRGYLVALPEDATLELPVIVAERTAGTGALAPLPLVLGVAGLLVAAAILALVSGRRRRTAPVADDIADVPLVVEGLLKEYSNGFRAVDGVTWRAERGQVVGLLGPNGAGKTTTMRMLVGLISADAGSMHVLGQPVTAGAPVLARVGALIEGPGFLPHLTGRENLAAYWAATGRPPDPVGLEEALATADLGVAVDRPVRSYSQGMRQRLGIAQALLGTPELLLLDEPTNGLDPPQIRRMRGMLASYAAAGRTVVISSHLLSEVEQTCSHVVVMHRGRVVLEGAVADLVEQSGSTVVTVEGTADHALEVLRSLGGVEAVDVDAQTDDGARLRVRGTIARPELVARLVEAGVPVAAVDGRRHLEEVFMGLVGDGEPAQIDIADDRDADNAHDAVGTR